MKNFRAVFYILLITAVPFVTTFGGERNFTAADHVKLEMPSSIALSPDGKLIAFTIRKPNLETSTWMTQVYLLTIADKSVRQITSSTSSCFSPAWSPDGKWLTFVSSREFFDDTLHKHGGSPQLFALPMNGGEAIALTDLPNGVEEYHWSPDGKMIALLSEEELPEAKQAEMERRKKLKMDWTSSLDPKQGKDFWLFDVASRTARKVKTLDRGVEDLSWSPNNRTLVYQTNYTGEYNDEQKYDLWTIDIDGNQTQLTSAAGPETHARFSPDGKSIAYITQTVPDIEFAKTELNVMDADGKRSRNLTKKFIYAVNNCEWPPDGKAIIVEANERTNGYLYKVNPETGKLEKLADGAFTLAEISTNRSGLLATTQETATTLREIALIKKGSIETLTDFSKQLASFPQTSQDVITVKSRDGKYNIEAVLIKPANYIAGKKYPLLLAYHGGPFGNYHNVWYQYYPVEEIADEGAMVVMPNVRGSAGYSDEFAQSNRYDLGGGDFRDAMDVVDYLIQKGFVDSTKMGVTGGSYGGYMTNWTISQTPRFKSAVSMYGIFSWFTDWSNSFQPSFEQMYFGYNYWEKPLDMNSLWIRTSAMAYVKNIVTPTLILHGTEDVYTNIANSREMYQALHELGRTVEFVVYPRAGHGLRNEPNEYINVLDRSVQWFDKYALEKE
jgi:dipeptidyl aminopeptidase/acylaminoacyl peptidase